VVKSLEPGPAGIAAAEAASGHERPRK